MLFPLEERGRNTAEGKQGGLRAIAEMVNVLTVFFKWIISIFAHKIADSHNLVKKATSTTTKRKQLDYIFLFLCWGVYELCMYELVLGKKEEWEQKMIQGLRYRFKLGEPVAVWYTEFGPQNTGKIIIITQEKWNIANIWN